MLHAAILRRVAANEDEIAWLGRFSWLRVNPRTSITSDAHEERDSCAKLVGRQHALVRHAALTPEPSNGQPASRRLRVAEVSLHVCRFPWPQKLDVSVLRRGYGHAVIRLCKSYDVVANTHGSVLLNRWNVRADQDARVA